jgi:tRNA pseudouridine55 synthase
MLLPQPIRMTTEPTDFVLPVDKPVGPTSHDVVALARRALGTRRIGHTGTLDPFASGLLLLCVNRATRIAEYLSGLSKTYTGVLRLDATTDTDDHTGTIIETFSSWRELDRPRVEQAMQTLTGELDQIPPQYSAKKTEGERMYTRARRGEVVTLPPVRVEVKRFELKGFDLPEVHFEVECSSGTYIRALARDLGQRLGVGGHLTQLRRIRVGNAGVNEAVTLDQLPDGEAVARARKGVLDALSHLPHYSVAHDDARRLAHGQAIHRPATLAEAAPLVITTDGELVALARTDGEWIRPQKVWAAGD